MAVSRLEGGAWVALGSGDHGRGWLDSGDHGSCWLGGCVVGVAVDLRELVDWIVLTEQALSSSTVARDPLALGLSSCHSLSSSSPFPPLNVSTAIGQWERSCTSGHRMWACIIMVLAIDMTVWIDRSATPFW